MPGKGDDLSQRFPFFKGMIFCLLCVLLPCPCDSIGSLPSECGGINKGEGNFYCDHWSGDPVRGRWLKL